MRLVTLDSRDVGGRPGVWLPSDEILDLAAAPGTLGSTQWLPQSVVSVLAQGEEGRVRIARLVAEVDGATDDEKSRLRANGVLLPYRGTELLPPVRRPGLLLMADAPGAVAGGAYIKNPNSAAGPLSRVTVPVATSERIVVVPRIGVVLGRALFAASPEQAERAISAYTLVADLDRRGDSSVDGRQFPGACPIGPALITIDEFAGAVPVPIGLRINGHEVREWHWDSRPAAFATLLALISRSYALRPGDIVALRAAPAGKDDTLGRGDRVALSLGSLMELSFSISA